MAIFHTVRQGYTTVGEMVADIVEDMKANGFVVKFPTAWQKPTGAALTKYNVTLEAGEQVDPLNAAAVQVKQPWRIKFDVLAAQQLGVYVATPLQLKDDGTHAMLNSESGSAIDASGAVGAQPGSGGIVAETDPTQGFVNRGRRIGSSAAAYPMTYTLSISDRGLFLGVWEDNLSATDGAQFSWMLVQRPVDRETGQTVITGKAPVFCLNSNGNKYWRFVVREADMMAPSKRVPADEDSDDYDAIVNSKQQVALTEDNKYVVTFPSRLNTSRYRYTHELDMIGTTSADTVSQGLDIPVTAYGEAQPRVYRALHANGVNNTGMRVAVLRQEPA